MSWPFRYSYSYSSPCTAQSMNWSGRSGEKRRYGSSSVQCLRRKCERRGEEISLVMLVIVSSCLSGWHVQGRLSLRKGEEEGEGCCHRGAPCTLNPSP